MSAAYSIYFEKSKVFLTIMSVRTKLIVLTVLSDNYFKINFHRPEKKKVEKKSGGE